MNYETICNPVPGAEVNGFNFFRDQRWHHHRAMLLVHDRI